MLCTSGLVDDVVFYVMEPTGQKQSRSYVCRVRRVAEPTAKSTVCILLLLITLTT